MVYYRTYRPQTLEELDSESIRTTLSAVLSKDSTPHAFLFTGPKGLGKTSTARIVAKILNCEKKKKGSAIPCNTCDQCISVTHGNNLDVIEIDGASHRGIDEIRDLREKVRLSPVSAQKKVYIIDEVHMLTTEAFNALLKTLEEPPAHVIFILCTTERHKVPETIMSRCFQVQFTRATDEELTHSLERIAKGEKFEIEKTALSMISRFADGSFRDAAKILEEIVAVSSSKHITSEDVEKQYKSTSIGNLVREFITLLHEKKTSEGLGLIQKLVDQGIDLRHFMDQLFSALHDMLLKEVGVLPVNGGTVYPSLGIVTIKKLVQLLSQAYQDMKYAPIGQLPLEMVVIEWGAEEDKGEGVKRAVEKKKSEPVVAEQAEKAIFVKSDSPFLEKLIAEVKKENFSVAGVLRGCVVKEQSADALVLEAGYPFHRDKLTESKVHELIEAKASEISGRKMTVSVALKGGE